MTDLKPWKAIPHKMNLSERGLPTHSVGGMPPPKSVLPVMDGGILYSKNADDRLYEIRQGAANVGGSGSSQMNNEKDPSGLSVKDKGAKLDAGKAPIFQGVTNYFPRAVRAVAMVSARGAEKYSWNGWETVSDGVNRYNNALGRHQLDMVIDGEYDKDGFLHRGQIAWNALAALELWLREQELK